MRKKRKSSKKNAKGVLLKTLFRDLKMKKPRRDFPAAVFCYYQPFVPFASRLCMSGEAFPRFRALRERPKRFRFCFSLERSEGVKG